MASDHAIGQSLSARAFRSGFLKLAILRLVAARPMHGYAMIERLTASDWRPSPGSIYPTLQEMQDGGLLSSRSDGRKQVYEITPLGDEVLTVAMERTRASMLSLQRLLDYRPE